MPCRAIIGWTQDKLLRLYYVRYRRTDTATDGEMMVVAKKTPELVEKVGRPNTYLIGTVNGMEIGSLVNFDVPTSFLLAF